jgi:hypothetical protein
MLEKFAGNRSSTYMQAGVNVLSVLFVLGWIGAIGFTLSQGAFEFAGMLIIFTVLITGLAYANERPE